MDEITRRHMFTSAAVVGAAAPPCEWTEAELTDRQRALGAGFTEDEADAWEHLARAGAILLRLPEIHPSDKPDFVLRIHALQEKLLIRPTYRKYRGIPATGK